MGDRAAADNGVAALLLAAGAGSRFAGPQHKLLATFRGRPLVEWAVAAPATAGLAPLIVVWGAVDVTAAARRAGGPDVVVIHNPAFAQGQATSLLAGLDECGRLGCTAAVVGLGDQPLVGPGAWGTVAATPFAPVVTATYGGRRSPPVRLDRSVWGLLDGGGDEGAPALMRRRPDLVTEVACEGDPSDVDTLEDLDRARSAAARTPGSGGVPGPAGPDGAAAGEARE